MTCENEMNHFFVRNCFSEKEREKVKASPAYQLAVEKSDTIQAQEIATQVLEAKAITWEEFELRQSPDVISINEQLNLSAGTSRLNETCPKMESGFVFIADRHLAYHGFP